MDDARGRYRAQLEELAAGVPTVPPLRYLEARAGAAAGAFTRRSWHSRRRRHGRRLWRACVVRDWMVQSLLGQEFRCWFPMAFRKSSDPRPQIMEVSPAA